MTDNKDKVNIGEEMGEGNFVKFIVICPRCGNRNIEINDYRACGSSQTGRYGSIDLICPKCNATQEIASND